MKTSNKILVGAYIAALLVAFSTMAYIRVNTEIAKPIEPIGEVRTETINMSQLTFIEASVGNIMLLPGEPRVELTCADNIFSYLKRGDDNGKFYLHKQVNVPNEIQVDVKVYTNDLKNVLLYSRARLSSQIPFQVDSLYIKTYNSSRVEMNIEANVCTVNSYNQSLVTLEGTTNQLNAYATNQANLEAQELVARIVDVETQNEGIMNLYPTEKLLVKVSNRGQVNYIGDPEIIQKSVINSGRLNQMKSPN